MSHHGERQWNKAQHFDAEATRRGIEREGDCLCLRRGVTLRDEMGRTNTRNRELVTSTRWARKTLVIDRIGSALENAHLCPYIGGPADASTLCIDLNGHAVEISLPEPEYWSGAWKRIPLPVEHLREGENEVVFRAVEDAEWRLLMENGFLPDRSAVSDDAGQTWRSDEIGENDRGDGEYVVRLWLDQYAEEGEIISSPVDLLAIAAGQIIAAAGKVTNIELALDADLPANTSCVVEWRQGTTPAYDPATWSAWKPQQEAPSDASRFGQWRLLLSTTDPSVTPVVRGVTLQVDSDTADLPGWTIADGAVNAPLVRSSFRFAHMATDDVRGKILRERWALDKVVGAAKTEFEAFVLLRQWVREQWEDGWNMGALSYVPPWDAPVILELASQQLALGMCTHYATVFTQCCAALGFYARTQVMRAHCLSEVWSNDYGKWVTMDPGGDSDDKTKCTYHFERDGIPLSALEAHLAYVQDDFDNIEVSPKPAPETKGRFTVAKRIGLWGRFMISLRNDETATLEPGEPEHGQGTYHYDGYLWWQDEKTPPQPHFSRHTDRAGDFHWDLHRTHMHLQAGGDSLIVDLDTETPNLVHFEIRLDGGAWEERPAHFEVPVHDGENRLESRAVNGHGRAGAISQVTIAV
jgi:hypothetical protein